tara:strand:- start:197 stop:574 length:378 start_codon:yes stop_codon:yes gene_type:complete
MNQIIAGIYGTQGFEKTASEDGDTIDSLHELAYAIVIDDLPEGSDLEKVASVHDNVLEELVFFDIAGRSSAQAEFSAMEKAASEGDWAPLEAFFAEEVDNHEGIHSEAAQLKHAILVELQSRVSS